MFFGNVSLLKTLSFILLGCWWYVSSSFGSGLYWVCTFIYYQNLLHAMEIKLISLVYFRWNPGSMCGLIFPFPFSQSHFSFILARNTNILFWWLTEDQMQSIWYWSQNTSAFLVEIIYTTSVAYVWLPQTRILAHRALMRKQETCCTLLRTV